MKKFFSLSIASLFMAAITFLFIPLAFATDIEPTMFLAQVVELVNSWGGLPWYLRVSGVITILLSSIKVSIIRTWTWDKLGKDAKFWAPMVLALIGGLFAHGQGVFKFDVIFAYLTAGAGAIVLHQILDAVKLIPGIGSVWVGIIEILKLILKAPKEDPEMEIKDLR